MDPWAGIALMCLYMLALGAGFYWAGRFPPDKRG